MVREELLLEVLHVQFHLEVRGGDQLDGPAGAVALNLGLAGGCFSRPLLRSVIPTARSQARYLTRPRGVRPQCTRHRVHSTNLQTSKHERASRTPTSITLIYTNPLSYAIAPR